MKDPSDDLSQHEWTPLPRSYISLPLESKWYNIKLKIIKTNNYKDSIWAKLEEMEQGERCTSHFVNLEK